ncbi:MAG: MFS transporter [Nitrososphaerota archaeon]|nr:MFS transporter [Nitrososphaerota archaeon]
MVAVDEVQQGPKLNQLPSTPSFDRKYANRTLILFATVAATVMYVEMMLTPSLPKISLQYGIDAAQASLILSLYTVFGTAINPIVGKLGDIYGKKKILTFVLIAYSCMVTLTSFAPDYTILVISRTFQGIGLGIFPLAFSLVREEFPRDLIPRAQGMISAMFGAGMALGLPVGALIANNWGWQTNYHIATPVIIALTIVAIITVRESAYRNPNAKMDYVGAGVLGAALASIVLGLSEGANWGWHSTPVLALLIAGPALFVPLVLYERRLTAPILDFKQLSQRNVLISNIVGMAVGLGMLLAFQSIVYQLEYPAPSGFGFSIFKGGLYLLPMAITMLIVMYPVGVMISRIGTKPFIFGGSAIGALGFLLLSTATTSGQIAEYLAVTSVGLAMLMASIQNLLVLSVRPQEMGLATAMNTVFRNFGSSLGAPIAGSILSTFTILISLGPLGKAPFPTHIAYTYTYYVAVAVFVVAFVVALFAHEVIGKKAKPDIVENNTGNAPSYSNQ